MVRTALVAAATLALCGCQEFEDTSSKAEWAEVQASSNLTYIQDLRSRMDDLEARVEELETQNRQLRDDLGSTSDQADRIADQVANNARVYNQHLDDFAAHRHH